MTNKAHTQEKWKTMREKKHILKKSYVNEVKIKFSE